MSKHYRKINIRKSESHRN